MSGSPVLMHGDDMELYRHLDVQAAWLGTRPPDVAQVDTLLREGDTLRWGRFSANVLHTPGHTPGSVSLYMAPEKHVVAGESAEEHVVEAMVLESGKLLAGDTLFAGSIGRTDLWGGSMPQILRSIRSKLLVLPEETIVFPGHGDITTIGRERESNPFLEAADGSGR